MRRALLAFVLALSVVTAGCNSFLTASGRLPLSKRLTSRANSFRDCRRKGSLTAAN
ncbi:hypothetical protein [Haladaptatus halobius]|uniref:hypothetical protein n=1 Tax=Haladaptatus halobius TaxID=2884875 RepID=UPI001D09B576|nr:hypothetical protein [Haladaptatus halobius]